MSPNQFLSGYIIDRVAAFVNVGKEEENSDEYKKNEHVQFKRMFISDKPSCVECFGQVSRTTNEVPYRWQESVVPDEGVANVLNDKSPSGCDLVGGLLSTYMTICTL